MVVTIMKTPLERLKPRVINYKDYKSFKNKVFREELLYKVMNATLEENANCFEEFIEFIQIYHQEILKRIVILLQIFFIPVLIIQFLSLNFHQSLNWPISLLSLKRVAEILGKIIDQSAYFQASQKSLNDACFVKIPVLWILF